MAGTSYEAVVLLRSPCRLDKACCGAYPSKLVASGGLFGGFKAGFTFIDTFMLLRVAARLRRSVRVGSYVVRLGMVTYDSRVFLRRSLGAAMLVR